MKTKLIICILLILFAALFIVGMDKIISHKTLLTVQKSDSEIQLTKKNDTLNKMVVVYEANLLVRENKITLLSDSIKHLISVQMTANQFIELYKYNRLLKYYTLCTRRSDYWKYYKGWSIRVFELQNKNYKPTDYVPDASTLKGWTE